VRNFYFLKNSYNALLCGRLGADWIARQWRSHAQTKQRKGFPTGANCYTSFYSWLKHLPWHTPKYLDDATEREQCETSLSLRGLNYDRRRRLALEITAQSSVTHCLPSGGELRQLTDKYTDLRLKS
jgi:hypothetical protein